MSTPPPPQSPVPASYNAVELGGTLAAVPQPNENCFLLRRDQFHTLRDGETNISRSVRDVCVGVFLSGVIGIAGIFLTIDWAVADKMGRHPVFWTVVIISISCTAFIVGTIEWIRIRQTHGKSAYSRLINTINEHFGPE